MQLMEVYAADGRQVLCSAQAHATNRTPCSHKEVDTVLLLHVVHTVQRDTNKVTIWTVDTDGVVTAVTCFNTIKPEGHYSSG